MRLADVGYCPESAHHSTPQQCPFRVRDERRCSKTEEDFFGLVALIRTPRCSISQGPVQFLGAEASLYRAPALPFPDRYAG